MFEISVTQEFSAAHRLPEYQGQCSNIHGHTWKVSISVIGASLDRNDMVMDFKDLKSALSQVLDRYDHRFINEIPPFDKINPTAENIAQEIYRQLNPLYSEYNLKKVTVWESHSSCATYWED
ncbi:MAG: 6-carboxytetrahydropterin synthase QueD [Syntrophomonadaceae bacterium]|nr:6-carboxytetrahydropterin synthase QueD [Syntrophomonadaceae bacterium]